MPQSSIDSFQTLRAAEIGGAPRRFYSVVALSERFPEVARLPVSLRILLENLLRHENGESVAVDHVEAVARRPSRWGAVHEVPFSPSRVILQDYSGLVALVDLATLRDHVRARGGGALSVNPTTPCVLVVDHSLVVRHAGRSDAEAMNIADEYARNSERYEFLKWAQRAFRNLRVVPPGNGIVHQINLEQIAEVVSADAGTAVVHPDTHIGTDSHTTMVNGLGVLGWGVGGIEAEAVMLGEPIALLVPDVIGVRLVGEMRSGVLATDIVLTLTERLRQFGVVDRFVEFYGPGVAALTAGDRATIANMAPEYGATCGLFPVDAEVARYLALTGRSDQHVALVRDYVSASGLWDVRDRAFADVVDIDLSVIGRCVAGPKRPHERRSLSAVPGTIEPGDAPADGLQPGAVVIAAITSCTNTSNAHAMIAAGLVAQRAVVRGLRVPPYVKATLSPGSRTVVDYLARARLLAPLADLGFHVVGFGCATCVGNTGPLNPGVEQAIVAGQLAVASVLSGNRNFEGRIHPLVELNYLASPALVVAYALAGTVRRDLDAEPIGIDCKGEAVWLHDLWPDRALVDATVERVVARDLFGRDAFSGGERWEALPSQGGETYAWRAESTYVRPAPFIEPMPWQPIRDAAPLLVLGDQVTTDHISPVGPIPPVGAAADWLRTRGIPEANFDTFGARRGDAAVMTRGTFSHPRLRNELVAPREGAVTSHGGMVMSIFEAAERYRRDRVPVVVVAGKHYGVGSARDWAAKGTLALGVRAVVAESFERIHRANLVLMGVLPLELVDVTRADLAIDLDSRVSVALSEPPRPRQRVEITIDHPLRPRRRVWAVARVDTAREADYLVHGGVLPAVAQSLIAVPEPPIAARAQEPS